MPCEAWYPIAGAVPGFVQPDVCAAHAVDTVERSSRASPRKRLPVNRCLLHRHRGAARPPSRLPRASGEDAPHQLPRRLRTSRHAEASRHRSTSTCTATGVTVAEAAEASGHPSPRLGRTSPTHLLHRRLALPLLRRPSACHRHTLLPHSRRGPPLSTRQSPPASPTPALHRSAHPSPRWLSLFPLLTPLPAPAELRPRGEFCLSLNPRAPSSSSFPIDMYASGTTSALAPSIRFPLCSSSPSEPC